MKWFYENMMSFLYYSPSLKPGSLDIAHNHQRQGSSLHCGIFLPLFYTHNTLSFHLYEVSGSKPEPYMGKVVVSYQCLAVHSTEPCDITYGVLKAMLKQTSTSL